MGKNAHLLLSATILLIAGLGYGASPSNITPLVLGFEPEMLTQKHILRAIMGLYFGLGAFWALGALKQIFWYAATVCNIFFMGGIAFGRGIALCVDGFSNNFFIAMVLELVFMLWGLYNLKKYART